MIPATIWIKGSATEACYKAWKAGIPAYYVGVHSEDKGTKTLGVDGTWADDNEALIGAVCDCYHCRIKRGEEAL